jgi:enamine deaminase RidA (YjgF/YER057c/UK114 family)
MATTSDAAGIEARVRRIGITLPAAPRPFGAYVATVQTGNLLFLSGTLATGRAAARLAALNALALARDHLGSLDRIRRAARVGVSIASPWEFREHPRVADGASELLKEGLGPERTPCRMVSGVSSLPLGSPVLLELILEVAG